MGRDDVEARIVVGRDGFTAGGRASLEFHLTAREAVKIRGAHVSFRGYEETKAVYTTSDGKTTTSHTATERHELVGGESTFLGQAPKGFLHNLVDGGMTLLGGGDHVVLEPGPHVTQLDVALPDPLLPSFGAKKVRRVYEAEVRLDIPAGRDFAHTVAFDVPRHAEPEWAPSASPLTISHPGDAGRGFFDKLFGPDVAMRVSLDSTIVACGGEVTVEVEVRFDDRPANVRAVVVKLVRRESSRALSHADRHAETVATERDARRDEGARALFSTLRVRVPRDAIPSCKGKNFELEYELCVALDVPWAKDPTVRIPVVVVG